MKTYVRHDGYRWQVLRTVHDEQDGPMHELMRIAPFGNRLPKVLWAKATECTPWKAEGIRRIVGVVPLRGRKVIFEFVPGTDEVRLRLSRQRTALTATLGGLYDTLARQKAANERRDRAFKRRTKRR
ncbi:MAG TPA: hypothetical protein VI229_00175 [Burkholderiales bacterium]